MQQPPVDRQYSSDDETFYCSRISIRTIVPPAPGEPLILQRADDVRAIWHMLEEPMTGVVVLTGDSAAGKSMLAALVYRHLESAAREGTFAIQRFVWLSIGPNATLPEVMVAILDSLSRGIEDEAPLAGTLGRSGTVDFLLLKPEQQISLLMERLRYGGQGVFIVLDQFDELLDAGKYTEPVGRGAVALFLEALQQDTGASRFLLTSYRSPFGSTNGQQARTRSYSVSPISLPEGVALLQQRGVEGAHQELSPVWQRCGGQLYALVLFSALSALSGFALSHLLDSPGYVQMWSGEVKLNLVKAISYSLNPDQRMLMRALCLFSEPVPIEGLMVAIVGEKADTGLYAFEYELDVLTSLSLVQLLIDENDERSYILPALVRQFMIAHYLDGSTENVRRNAHIANALGVATVAKTRYYPNITPVGARTF